MSSECTSQSHVFNLIADTPSSVDEFEGPHRRLADAVCRIIERNANDGEDSSKTISGRATTIALEGSWGSGKSSIVRMICDRLDEKDGVLTIEFDAWSHEGDPLRRTFLEKVIERLRKESREDRWISTETAERVKGRISKKLRTTEIETKARPTRLGFFSSLSILLIPLGAAIVAHALRDGHQIWPLQPAQEFSSILLFGLFLAFAPFLVAIWHLIVYLTIWQRCKQCFYRLSRVLRKKNWILLRWPLNWLGRRCGKKPVRLNPFDLENWPLFARHDSKEETSHTTEDLDPTSVEFEEEFCKVMSEALRRPNRRLVLIMDNLDRVNESDALKLWSTMQTFLSPSVASIREWHHKLTVIVPYDRKGISKLWSDQRRLDGTVEHDGTISESFLDKSFQIRLTVPPLVLSTWQEYLSNLLVRALPGLSQEECEEICRVYDLCSNDFRGKNSDDNRNPNKNGGGPTPTPRQLKLFVNQIGALLSQWNGEIPVSHVAYYVINCSGPSTHDDIPERLRSGELPGNRGKQLYGDELAPNIASLYFNELPEKATEVLLLEPILDALANQEPDKLDSLASNQPKGFWLIMQRLGVQRPIPLELADRCIAALTLRETQRIERQRPEFIALIKSLVETFSTEEALVHLPVTVENYEGLGELCKLHGQEYMSQTILDAVRVRMRDFAGSGESPGQWALALAQFISTSKIDVSAMKVVDLPFDEKEWVEACNLIEKQKSSSRPSTAILSKLKPSVEADKIETYLITQLNGGDSLTLVPTLLTTQQAFPNFNWSQLVEVLTTRLSAETPSEWPMPVNVLNSLWSVAEAQNKIALKRLKGLVESGNLLHHLDINKERKEFVHLCGFTYMVFRPTLGDPVSFPGQAQAGIDFLKEFLASPDSQAARHLLNTSRTYGQSSFLLNVLKKCEDVPELIYDAALEASQRGDWQEFFPISTLIDDLDVLQDALATNEKDYYLELINHVSRNGSSESRSPLQFELESRGFEPASLSFYEYMLETDIEWFPKWVADTLNGFSKVDWLPTNEPDFAAFQLLQQLLRKGHAVHLGSHFADALFDLAV